MVEDRLLTVKQLGIVVDTSVLHGYGALLVASEPITDEPWRLVDEGMRFVRCRSQMIEVPAFALPPRRLGRVQRIGVGLDDRAHARAKALELARMSRGRV